MPSSLTAPVCFAGLRTALWLALSLTSCTFITGVFQDKCGDGFLEGDEVCDDGDTVNGDGCSSICQTELFAGLCGDGVLNLGEQCDDGNTANSDGCLNTCILATCGGSFWPSTSRSACDTEPGISSHETPHLNILRSIRVR